MDGAVYTYVRRKNMQSFQKALEKIWANRWNSDPYQTLLKIKDTLANRKLVFYGAGRLAKVFWDICVELKIPVTEIWDKNIQGIFEPAGLPIIFPPSNISGKLSDLVVLVCSHSFNMEICLELMKQGFSKEQIIPCLCKNPYYGTSRELLEGYEWAFYFFSDPTSRQLVLDKCALQILDRELSPNTQADCYYEDCFTFGNDEVFIDGGAYIGDSAEQFSQHVNGNYKHIYAFEPDKENFKKAEMQLKMLPNTTLISSGLWNKSGQMEFMHDPELLGSSLIYHATEYTTSMVSVVALDELFADKQMKDWPTFIKMDIEGAEKQALFGAKNIIRKKKPKLAICAYHKIEDIYELPQTILSIRPDYHMILRQYEFGRYETILYAY